MKKAISVAMLLTLPMLVEAGQLRVQNFRAAEVVIWKITQANHDIHNPEWAARIAPGGTWMYEVNPMNCSIMWAKTPEGAPISNFGCGAIGAPGSKADWPIQ